MRFARPLLLLAVLLATCSRAFADSFFYRVSSQFGDKRIQSTVNQVDLDGTVKWLPEASFPLGMHTVLSNAQKAFASDFPDYGPFSVRSIDLVHLKGDNWIFAVDFIGPLPDSVKPMKSKGGEIILLVLLNGKVVVPVVTTINLPPGQTNSPVSPSNGYPYPRLTIPDFHPAN